MKFFSLAFVLALASCSPSPCFAEVPVDVERLAEAIYRAEGGAKAKKPYGILSVPCEGKEHCGRICKNTIRNNIKRWEKAGKREPYLEFLAKRYAPTIGANNDPNGLNRHWLGNVRSIYASINNNA
jgi:hypothetical protein